MNELRYDLVHAMLWLRRNWRVTVLAVVTIALGIGPTTAVFSVVNALVLQPLPFSEQQRLVCLWSSSPEKQQERLSAPDAADLQRCSAFSGSALYVTGVYEVNDDQGTEELATIAATAESLATLGVTPVLGRHLQPADEQRDAEQVVLLGFQQWQRRYGGDPGVLGKKLTVRGVERTIVGVLPQSFGLMPAVGGGAERYPIWIPFPRWAGWASMRGFQMVYLVARLRPGVSLPQAQAEVETVAVKLQQLYPDSNRDRRFHLLPIEQHILGSLDTGLLLLLGAVGFVVLIACTNVANLLLALGISRRREIATRFALGATRGRIVRRHLLESLLLGLTGGAVGVLLGAWGLGLLLRLAPPGVPRLDEVGVDARVLLFSATISVMAGLALGLVPALQHRRLQLRSAIDDRSIGTSTAGGAGRWSELIAVGQIALAAVLLIGAGLMIHSFSRLLAVDPGFAADHLLAIRLRVPAEVPGESFFRQLPERLEALPGVTACSTMSYLPFAHPGYEVQYRTVDDTAGRTTGNGKSSGVQQVSPGLFRTMGIPLLEGRDFAWDDVAADTRPVVVSRSLASSAWPGRSPLGGKITMDPGPFREPGTVIGVVADSHQGELEQPPRPALYFTGTRTGFATYLVARTSAEPARVAEAVRAAIIELQPRVAILQVSPMRDLMLSSVATPRFVRWLLAVLSGLATALALVGIYGVMSYNASRRTGEIGVRMSFGATPRSILRLMLQRGLRLALAGVTLGLLGALALTRLLSNLLYETSATDPPSLLAAVLLLLAAALFACLVPALRAARTDPMAALRRD